MTVGTMADRMVASTANSQVGLTAATMVESMVDQMAAWTDLSSVVMMVGLMDYSLVDSTADPRDNSQADKMVVSTADMMAASTDLSTAAPMAVSTE